MFFYHFKKKKERTVFFYLVHLNYCLLPLPHFPTQATSPQTGAQQSGGSLKSMKDKSNQPEKDSKEGSTLQIAGDLVAGLLFFFFITILVAGLFLIWIFSSQELSKESNADLHGLGSVEFFVIHAVIFFMEVMHLSLNAMIKMGWHHAYFS